MKPLFIIANPILSAARLITIPIFCAFAFLPSVLHLVSRDIPVTHPGAALGPVVAGFWFMTGLRRFGAGFALIGTGMAVLLWAANWLMMAGHICCATPN